MCQVELQRSRQIAIRRHGDIYQVSIMWLATYQEEYQRKELEERWQKGPKFLNQPEEQWPNQQVMSVNLKEIERECQKTEVVLSVVAVPTITDSTKFSKWKRLVRVTAWILRYV